MKILEECKSLCESIQSLGKYCLNTLEDTFFSCTLYISTVTVTYLSGGKEGMGGEMVFL